MTNIDDNNSYDARAAALLAVHLVSQVLDEAYVIANAAKESGEPWSYISSLKKLRTRLDDTYHTDLTYTVSKGDYNYIDENNIDNEVVTSTPQKSEDNFAKTKNDAFIGQGDEDFEVANNKLRKSTSMFINNLFDMSDVERFICNDESTDHGIVENNILIEDMANIIDSYINCAINTVFQTDINYESKSNDANPDRDTASSSFSYLADAFCPDSAQNVAFYIDEVACNEVKENNVENTSFQNSSKINSNDVAMYEKAYLTLNRDYEASDEEEPVLKDPKTMIMQEVELLTANTSTASLKQDKKALAATSGVSTQLSRKSNLVRRCRIQGSKLLSCLRGLWWRRRLGKRKECRGPGSIHGHGLCPLSPEARRRAASLLDQRRLRTPSPSRTGLWKFNTVNEALVHSSRWKDYSFKMSLNENDEF